MSAGKRVTRSLIAQENLETTEGHYSPVRLKYAMLGSSLLYGTRAVLFLNQFPAYVNTNTQLVTVSMETLCMAKSRPRKNQSERSD